MDNLQLIIKNYLKINPFTHLYLSFGELSRRAETFSLLPDGQDEFDVASLTKIIVTAPLVFKLMSFRGLHFDSSLNEVLPRKKLFKQSIMSLTLGQLLQHTSGLPDWLAFWILCEGEKTVSPRQQVLNRINSCELRNVGGRTYSDVGFLVLSFLLEEFYQQSLDELFVNFCRRDLSLKGEIPHFHPNNKSCSNSVPTAFCSLRNKRLRGEVHDENAFFLEGIAGHAGIFSTGPILIDYFQALFRSELGDFLLKETVKRLDATKEMISISGFQQGRGQTSLGFLKGESIGHLGFTGTSFWMHPKSHLYGLLLTNRVMTSRVSASFHDFRRDVYHEINKCLIH